MSVLPGSVGIGEFGDEVLECVGRSWPLWRGSGGRVAREGRLSLEL